MRWPTTLIAFLFMAFPFVPVDAADNDEWLRLYKSGRQEMEQQHFSEAESLLTKAFAEGQKFGMKDRRAVEALVALAAVYEFEGKYADSEKAYRQVLTMVGESSPGLVICLSNLGSLYARMHRISDSIDCYEKALPKAQAVFGENSTQVSMIKQNLAEQRTHTGANTLAQLQESLAQREATLGPNNPDVAQSLNNLANWYAANDQFSKAEPLYKRSLSIMETQLGTNNQFTLMALENMGEFYLAQRKYELAEPFLKQAVDGREKLLGSNHPDVAASLQVYAQCLRGLNRASEAETFDSRARQILSNPH